MFKQILVPTDGAPLSSGAARMAMRLARESKAKVIGLYVVPEVPQFYSDGTSAGHAIVEKEFRRMNEQAGKLALEALQRESSAQEAAFEGVLVTGSQPWKEILKVAQDRQCDLIVMASHGRKGLDGLLLGSETTKVLTHSKTPVLVCR